MIDIVNLASFTLFIVGFIYLGFTASKLKAENNNLKVEIIKQIQENQVLKSTLDTKNKIADPIEKTDSFLAFLNQSRDWAFQYIETVQNGLIEYISKVGPILDYHKRFGGVVPAEPYKTQLDQIAESFDTLKNLLPETDKE